MIEISPILTSYPIQKIKKVARDSERQPDNKPPAQDNKKNDKNEESNDQPESHVDEIV